ncbi:hypothetical protein AGMMS50262_01760 [Bacteroidia bacterium]|nr:hypothetical protein AGMMS50262_01760 [Bacteroidia bacterium]
MNKVQWLWEKEIKVAFDSYQELLGGLEYAVFQTPYRPKPGLLVIGRNRNTAEYSHEAIFDRPVNLFTEGKKNGDPDCWDTVCDLFGYGRHPKLWELFDNAVGLNYTYFNEKELRDRADRNLQTEIRITCIQYTRKLIEEYICPKNIVIIGTEPISKIKNKRHQLFTVRWEKARAVKTFRENIPMYAIKDPFGRVHFYNQESEIQNYNSLFEHVLF